MLLLSEDESGDLRIKLLDQAQPQGEWSGGRAREECGPPGSLDCDAPREREDLCHT